DDAHAAAADLFEELIIAEVSNLGPRRWGRCFARTQRRSAAPVRTWCRRLACPTCAGTIRTWRQRRRQPLELVLVCEVRGQLAGPIGMAVQQLAAVRRDAGFDILQVVGEHLLQALLAA